MGKVIADLATSAASATFAVENATSSVDYVLSGTDGSANDHLKTDGSGNLAWVTPAGGSFSSYAVICDQKAAGITCGTFTSGAWRHRDLNTEITDTDGIVSIATNDFTLAAGTYLIMWSAPCYEGSRHKTRLYDVTGTAVVEIGSSGVASSATQTRSFGYKRVTPSGSNAYRIEHQCETTKATNGLGLESDFSAVEKYTIVEIYKEA